MTPEKLSNDLSIVVNEAPRSIRMTFNLLNRLTFIIGNVENIQEAMSAPSVRESLMCEALAVREEGGKRIVPANLDDIDLSPEDAGRLLNFIGDHVMDFFLLTLEQTNQRMSSSKDRMVQIRSTSAFIRGGPEASTSKMPAA